jgi:zinc transport system substrate-binding protein
MRELFSNSVGFLKQAPIWMLLSLNGAWAAQTASPHSPAQVYVTIGPLALLAQAITQGVSQPQTLLRAGQSVHFFSLTPEQIRQLNQADVVLWIAPELETPVERLMATARMPYHAPLIGLPDMRVLRAADASGHATHGHAHDARVDPHIWLSPENARIILMAIAAQLSEKDPQHAPQYQANLQRALARWDVMHERLKADFGKLEDTPYVVLHPAWRYLEQAYPLFNAGTLRMDPSRPPSVKQMQALKAFAEQAGVRCIIVEPTLDGRLAQRLAQMLTLRQVELDPLAGDVELSAQGYFEWMESLAKKWQTCN